MRGVAAPGAQMTVRDAGGVRWTGAVGAARPGETLSAEAPLLVGSVTKMFVAAVVLQLVDEGAVSLDDPGATWMPQLRPDVTVRDLLRHTSGMGEYSAHPTMTADNGAAMGEVWTPEALVTLGQDVADAGPSEVAAYANTNFIALGRIIEALDGRPVDEALEARVFAPLGLESTGLLVELDTAPPGLAWGDGGVYLGPSAWDPSVGWTAGALYTTTADLSRFLDAVFAAELYSEERLAEQIEPGRWDELDMDGVDLSYGLGMMVADVEGDVFYGHQGGLLGYTSLALLDPGTGASVALATNGTAVDVVSPGFGALVVAQ